MGRGVTDPKPAIDLLPPFLDSLFCKRNYHPLKAASVTVEDTHHQTFTLSLLSYKKYSFTIMLSNLMEIPSPLI